MMIVISSLFLTAPLLAAPKGKNLQDAEWWAEAERAVVKKGADATEKCKTKIVAAFDDRSYAGVGYDEARAQAACKHSIDALATTCRTDLGQAAVTSKVKRVVCRYSTSGTRVVIGDGLMVVHLDPKNTAIIGQKKGSYSWISAIKEQL